MASSSISTQSFTTLVGNLAAAIQGAATALVDFTVGSILRAVGEAHVAIALWLQAMGLEILALTRLSTSEGTDADSYCADFGFFRLPAQDSTGPVILARNTPTAQATVQAATNAGTIENPIWVGGAVVQTQDGTQQYQAIPDTTQSAFNAALNQYVIPAGTASITVTVEALTPGSASNAAAGAINTLGSAIAGVDRVTNAVSFANGADAESDPAFKARFVDYLNSLSKATLAAVREAIESVQQDVSFQIVENQTFAGQSTVITPQFGYFYVVVDDGSGNPPSSFLSAVFSAIDAVRPIGSIFGVFAPTLLTITVFMTIQTDPNYTHATLTAAVAAAITNYINALPIGGSLPFTRLAQIAYDTSPGVINVTGVTLGGGTSDVTVPSATILKAFNVTVR